MEINYEEIRRNINMVHNEEECAGCSIERSNCAIGSSYIDPETNEIIKCPCTTCLVKVICGLDSACEEYIKYRNRVVEKEHNIDMK